MPSDVVPKARLRRDGHTLRVLGFVVPQARLRRDALAAAPVRALGPVK